MANSNPRSLAPESPGLVMSGLRADNSPMAHGQSKKLSSSVGLIRMILPRRKKNLSTFDLIRVMAVLYIVAVLLSLVLFVIGVAVRLWPITFILLAVGAGFPLLASAAAA